MARPKPLPQKKVLAPLKPMKPAPPVVKPGEKVFITGDQRPALLVERTLRTARYLQFNPQGLAVESRRVEVFDKAFKQRPDLPDARAVDRFVDWAARYGATEEVLEFLGSLTTKHDKELEMAKKTNAAKAAGKPKMSEATKAALARKKGGDGKPKERKETAAAMFQALIMKGGKTSAQIFEAVKEKFGLDDKKRGYPSWYRGYLIRKGEKPPEFKPAVKAKKADK